MELPTYFVIYLHIHISVPLPQIMINTPLPPLVKTILWILPHFKIKSMYLKDRPHRYRKNVCLNV